MSHFDRSGSFSVKCGNLSKEESLKYSKSLEGKCEVCIGFLSVREKESYEMVSCVFK